MAFRRRSWPKGGTPGVVKHLQKITREKQRVVVPGVVLQELLSGVKDPAQGERIKELMEGYPLILATKEQHVEARIYPMYAERRGCPPQRLIA
jgi:predicted nucleic acid-binding protein